VVSQQSHGSARTREVKLGVIWSAEPFEEHGTPVREEGSVTYSAPLESAATRDTAVQRSPLAQRAMCDASPHRFCQAPRTLVRGDGTAGIWNIASDQFPEVVQMVHCFHAQQHWSDLGKSPYSPTGSRAAPWAKRRQEEVDAGQFRTILTAIRRHVARREEARLACTIFRPIETQCAIWSSMHRAYVPPPVW